ncbi:MAG: allantoinase AllB, partial [Planctomycetota bacterium]
ESLAADLPMQDYGDWIISPGIVDAHVHLNEPGQTEWEGFQTGTKAAAAGGVTSLIDMPLNSLPVTTTVDAWRQKLNASLGKLFVDVGFHGGVIPGSQAALQSLIQKKVCGIKAFLCHSGLDEFPGVGKVDLEQAASVLSDSQTVLLAHAEQTDAAEIPKVTDARSYQQYVATRPPEFELAAIEMLIEFCRQFETPVHIVHLATARAIPMIEAAKADGLPLTVETCPHYLFFTAENIPDGATEFKCAPPIRNEENRIELCKAVETGLIDTIGSDHSPCVPELKALDTGDFQKAWGGIAGLQLSLPVCWTLGRAFDWSPALLAERMSSAPAERFGLGRRKGRIEAGLDADFVIWNPDEEFELTADQLFHKHKVTPYLGCRLSAVVKETFVRGKSVFSHGQVDGEPSGTLLLRDEKTSHRVSDHLNSLLEVDSQSIHSALQQCCAAESWISRMISGGPFTSEADLMARAESSWQGLEEADYLQAFAAHPRIGDVNTLREKYANTAKIAGGEQSRVDTASESVLTRLATANDEYFEKFGFIFIVCATGKSADEMLAILESRLKNDRTTEINNAAAEQLKITRIRLRKLET